MPGLRSTVRNSGRRLNGTGVVRSARICSFALLLGCADPASPFEHVADNTGILRVRVTTEGPDVDANGYLVSIDDSRSFSRVTANGSVTPDGSRLAFTRTVCNATRDGLCYPAVIVTTATGQSPQEVDVGEEPVWSPHGRSIAVTRFTCDFFYSYSNPPCTVAGIGIVNAFPVSNLWYGVTWERELTTGAHTNPTWQR